jgi:hypothetical protein
MSAPRRKARYLCARHFIMHPGTFARHFYKRGRVEMREGGTKDADASSGTQFDLLCDQLSPAGFGSGQVFVPVTSESNGRVSRRFC